MRWIVGMIVSFVMGYALGFWPVLGARFQTQEAIMNANTAIVKWMECEGMVDFIRENAD